MWRSMRETTDREQAQRTLSLSVIEDIPINTEVPSFDPSLRGRLEGVDASVLVEVIQAHICSLLNMG